MGHPNHSFVSTPGEDHVEPDLTVDDIDELILRALNTVRPCGARRNPDDNEWREI
jgi:hypothetical protein